MEGEIHKHLKLIGMYWIKTKVTDLVCIEAKYNNIKSIADVCGINLKREEVRIIECKATKEDFLRDKKLMDINQSYYKHCHYFYILCPENIIQINDIPKEYGLLWANDKDEIIIKKNPIKYTGRLKTLFKTSLKNITRAATNTLLYYFSNKENKDLTDGKYNKNAKIKFCAIRCPKCKHVTKELINIQFSENIDCKYCSNIINLKNTNIREIIGFNNIFIKKINELKNKKDEL